MASEELKRYWLSWLQMTEDYRPLTFPPNKAILGWWCSGYDQNGHGTICALVAARDERAAWEAVDLDWPRKERIERFAKIVESDWLPGDRFPLSDWMVERQEAEDAKQG